MLTWDYKKCRGCEEEKPRDSFSPHARTSDRLRPTCKACGVAKAREWAAANPERAAANKRAYVERHPGRVAISQQRYRDAHARPRPVRTPAERAEIVRMHQRVRRASNPAKARMQGAQHQSNRRAAAQRRVAWYDHDAVSGMYALSAVFRSVGLRVEVDHVVPLRHPRVSGLHVQNNLELVPAAHNRAKGNRSWPEMP